MTSRTRSRRARRLGAWIGAAALVAALPAPAFAEHRDHGGHGHRQGRDCDHGRAHALRRGHAPVAVPRYAPAPPRRTGPRPVAYLCSRCRAQFASSEALAGHVHRHHRVPTWRVPGLLTRVSIGWVFGL